ncbi:MAG: hypothetical protein ACXVAY_12960 [Mucilaginibacter sp.]
MKKKLVIVLVSLFTITACRHQHTLHEIKDKELTLQVMELESVPGNGTTRSYKARLFPATAFREGKVETRTAALRYQMDSCFYLQAGRQKIYAAMVQPIANGIKGTYEYLIDFDLGTAAKDDCELVYQDKFLNHRKYQLKLND